MPVLMVRMDATADDSLAAMRARSKFGIAMAAMIRMIATTISSSISEKPFCLRISIVPLGLLSLVKSLVTNDAVVLDIAFGKPKQRVTFVPKGYSGKALFSLDAFSGHPQVTSLTGLTLANFGECMTIRVNSEFARMPIQE